MQHVYDQQFFEWVKLTGLRSGRRLLPIVQAAARPCSVIDVGCGEGAWLSVWAELAVDDITGLDGAYVRPETLQIPADRFVVADLAGSFAVDRRYDLAQSLEVAEHLPPAASTSLVDHLCAMSDIVLFSAAQPGQGGENHINEREPSFWAGLFARQGYAAFDCVRPALANDPDVAPWYRFNTVIYANPAGERRLSELALASRCHSLEALDGGGDLGWKVRRALLRPLPVPVVSWLSRVRYRSVTAMQRGRQAA